MADEVKKKWWVKAREAFAEECFSQIIFLVISLVLFGIIAIVVWLVQR